MEFHYDTPLSNSLQNNNLSYKIALYLFSYLIDSTCKTNFKVKCNKNK